MMSCKRACGCTNVQERQEGVGVKVCARVGTAVSVNRGEGEVGRYRRAVACWNHVDISKYPRVWPTWSVEDRFQAGRHPPELLADLLPANKTNASS
ncbi:hypothetical protein KM043_004219 [Ampulex compressa]|nr:hypothetical protein KM043_004219 [Ampulex compressa]